LELFKADLGKKSLFKFVKYKFKSFLELAALKKLRQNEEGKEISIQMKALFSICLIAIVCGAVYAFVPADDEPTFLVIFKKLFFLLKNNFRILIWIKKIFVQVFIAKVLIRLITNILIDLTTSKIKFNLLFAYAQNLNR